MVLVTLHSESEKGLCAGKVVSICKYNLRA